MSHGFQGMKCLSAPHTKQNMTLNTVHKSNRWLVWYCCHFNAQQHPLSVTLWKRQSNLDILHNKKISLDWHKLGWTLTLNLNVCVLSSNSSFRLSQTANTVSNLTHTHTHSEGCVSCVRGHLLLTLPEVSQGLIGPRGNRICTVQEELYLCYT